LSQSHGNLAGDGEAHSPYRWVVIGLLVLTQEISVLLVGAIGILLPSMREDIGFGIAESGILGSLGQLPVAALSIPASLILVRFRPKWVYLTSLLLAAVTGFFCGRATMFIFLAVPYCLMGLAMTIRQVPDTLLRLQWIPKKEFATVMGITMGMVAMGQSMGVMVVPFLMIVLDGWRNLFSLYSLAVVFLSIIWMVFARERTTPEYLEGMSPQIGRAPLSNVLKRKEFIILGIAVFGGPLAYMNTFLFLPTYLLEERGIALTTIGLIVGLMPVGGVCATFTVGFISDRLGLRKPTIWPPGLILPFIYFALLSPVPVWALPVLAFALGYLAWTPFPAIRTIPFELPGIRPSEVAVGQSLLQTITTLGLILGAPAVGYLAEALGSLGTTLRILCVFPLTLTISGLLIPETGLKARRKVEERAG